MIEDEEQISDGTLRGEKGVEQDMRALGAAELRTELRAVEEGDKQRGHKSMKSYRYKTIKEGRRLSLYRGGRIEPWQLR
ncbi:MAG: hypothetical protein AAGJ80_01600 [Cyanobacteria bacterium J06553_1]